MNRPPTERSLVAPRWRKVWYDLTGNWTRTLLVVLSISVGIFAVGVITSVRIMLPRDLTAGYVATNPASATLHVEPFDQTLVDVVRSIDGVREAEGRRSIMARVEVAPGTWRSIRLFAISDFDDMRINMIASAGGAWPPPERAVLIERSALELTGAQVGDDMLVEMSSGKQRSLSVAGLAYDGSQRPPFITGMIYGYITFDTLEWLGETRQFSELPILVSERATDAAHIRSVAEEVRSKIEKGGRTVVWTSLPRPLRHPVEDAMQAMIVLLGALGILSFLLSGFLVINTISALLTQQTRQIAVMKAIGGSTQQLMGMYLSVVVLFGLLALSVAVPLSALGSYVVATFVAGLLNFDLIDFTVPPQALGLQVAVGLLVPLVAALYPIWNGVRITVREAMAANALGESGLGHSLIDRVLERIRGLSRPLMLSLRNTFRRKGRLVLTLVTLTLSGATFIGVLSVRASTMLTIDDFARYWNYDVLINFTRPQRIERVEQEALRVPGVVAVESWGFISARRIRPDQIEGNNLVMVAPPADTRLLLPTLVAGRWLLPEDELAVVVNTDVLEDEPDMKLGDTVVFQVAGRKLTLQVVGVVRSVLSGPIAYVHYPYFSRAIGQSGRAESLRVVTENHAPWFQAQTAMALESHFNQSGTRVSSRETTSQSRALIESQFNVIIVFLLIMAVLLAIVGGLGLTGTVSINVLERTREIGVMRAIGASNVDLLRIVMAEGLIIGLISWVLGSLAALPLSQLLSERVGMALTRSPLTYTFSIWGMLLWLAIVTLLAALASLPPALAAARISVRDALAYE